ncbi:unnamed protein product [Fraxinus pennsylvanica]|uniref:Uncharacterized protein n=1 Tax=Fraxinus pennsylvanica TaxID=56036 RepID=A0AAD2A9E4_9LAMI|nr:unnamed protein product [Fraxinus pennsylvanica]
MYAPLGYLFESIKSWNSPNSNGIRIELRRDFLPDHILAVFTIPTVWNILGRETQSVRGTKNEKHVNISLTSIILINAQTKFKHSVNLLPKVFGSSRLNPELITNLTAKIYVPCAGGGGDIDLGQDGDGGGYSGNGGWGHGGDTNESKSSWDGFGPIGAFINGHVNISLTSIILINAQTKFKHSMNPLPKVSGSSRLNPESAVSNSNRTKSSKDLSFLSTSTRLGILLRVVAPLC